MFMQTCIESVPVRISLHWPRDFISHKILPHKCLWSKFSLSLRRVIKTCGTA